MDKTQRMCPACWEPYKIGGRHICKPKAAAVTTRDRNYVTTQSVTTPVTTQGERATTGVTTPEGKHVVKAGRGDKARVYRWRAANRERYNAYMRKRRADQKEGALI